MSWRNTMAQMKTLFRKQSTLLPYFTLIEYLKSTLEANVRFFFVIKCASKMTHLEWYPVS